MAQLKNTVVSGSIRATDTLYSTTNLFTNLNIPTTSNASTYGPGTDGQIVKSNGTSVFWSSPDSSITSGSTSTNIPTTAAVANFVEGKGYVLNSEITSLLSNVATSKAYAINDLFIYDNKLYQATAAIALGGIITPNTNCVEITLEDAFVKTTDIPTANTPGVVKIGGAAYGLTINNGQLEVVEATTSQIKESNGYYRPLTSSRTHAIAFYGLAKAAGDATQASSSNAIGTYTNDAKFAIQAMLGVGTVNETITGTTPTITAEPNHKYICGEVSLLTFTPCTYGICEVIFTSGSSPTVLTLPNTVKMPLWFDVDVNRIYDIIITDGVYGAVTSWAV